MAKTKEQAKTEIASALQGQTINALIDALAEAQVRIAELEGKLAEGGKGG